MNLFFFTEILHAQTRVENTAREMKHQLMFQNLLKNLKPRAKFEDYPFLVNEKGVEHFQNELLNLKNGESKFLPKANLAQQYLLNGETENCIRILEEIMPESKDRFLRRFGPDDYTGIKNLLAIAYLRLGEQENCIINHNAESCIIPIRNKGIYQLKNATRHSIALYQEILSENRDDLLSRWLMNIAYMSIGNWPDSVPKEFLIPLDRFDEKSIANEFNDIAPILGINNKGLSGSESLEDFDNDGDLDLFITQEGFDGPSIFLKNNGDNGFEDASIKAGIEGETAGRVTVHADYNNDGFIDIFVCRGGWQRQENNFPPNSLLRNNGDGTFTNVTIESGLLTFRSTSSAAWGDYDNDGWLDLFLGIESPNPESPQSCLLFHNNHDGTFSEKSKETACNVIGIIKGVVWGDYNNDGLQDLYLTNYQGRRYLLKNNINKKGGFYFSDETLKAEVSFPLTGIPSFFFDYDNDGWLDIFTPAHKAENNSIPGEYLGFRPRDEELPKLYKNNHNGGFEDVTEKSGLNRNLYVMGMNFGDIDYDGFPDIYAGTGFLDFRALYPNLLFRNNEGKNFQDVTSITRTGQIQKGHGIAFGDIDNDGDQDIYAVMGGGFSGDIYSNVLYNNSGNSNKWIYLNLKGIKSNRSAIGTRIKVTIETENGNKEIYTTVNTGGSFGASCLRREIGLGKAKSIRKIEVFWPASNLTQVFTGLEMDKYYQITEGEKIPKLLELKPIKFKNPKENKSGIHHE